MGTETAPSSLAIKPYSPHSRIHDALPPKQRACADRLCVFATIDGNNMNDELSSTSEMDSRRDDLLRISRGSSVVLLVMCAPLNWVAGHLVLIQANTTSQLHLLTFLLACLQASVATVRWQLRFFAPCMAILTIYGAKFWTNSNTTGQYQSVAAHGAWIKFDINLIL